jgi:hypothetical protein
MNKSATSTIALVATDRKPPSVHSAARARVYKRSRMIVITPESLWLKELRRKKFKTFVCIILSSTLASPRRVTSKRASWLLFRLGVGYYIPRLSGRNSSADAFAILLRISAGIRESYQIIQIFGTVVCGPLRHRGEQTAMWPTGGRIACTRFWAFSDADPILLGCTRASHCGGKSQGVEAACVANLD